MLNVHADAGDHDAASSLLPGRPVTDATTTAIAPNAPLAIPPVREAHAAWSALDGIDDLGVQYANVYGRTHPARNHLRLMAAVLNDAIRVLSKHRSPRRRREELAWLTSHDRKLVFAFENVCEALNIDADRVRLHVIAQCGAPAPAPKPALRIGARSRSTEYGSLRRAG